MVWGLLQGMVAQEALRMLLHLLVIMNRYVTSIRMRYLERIGIIRVLKMESRMMHDPPRIFFSMD